MDLALPLRPPKIQGLKENWVTFQPNLCPPQKCVFSELFGVLTRKTGNSQEENGKFLAASKMASWEEKTAL